MSDIITFLEEVDVAEPVVDEVNMMLDMDDVGTEAWGSNYNLLGEDDNLKLSNIIQVDPRNTSQVICSVIFKNLTSHHIQKLELNVIDSLNMKVGTS